MVDHFHLFSGYNFVTILNNTKYVYFEVALPMVSISMDLEGGFTRGTVVAEQFLQCDDAGDGQCDLASDQSLARDRG